MARNSVLRDAVAGVLAGVVVSTGLGVSQLLTQAHTMGVDIGIDGSTPSVFPTGPPWLYGFPIAVVAAALFLSRAAWWNPRLARVIVLAIVVVLTGFGIALSDFEYTINFPFNPWRLAIPVEMSNSVATYAFIGIGFASLVGSRRQSRDADQKPELAS